MGTLILVLLAYVIGVVTAPYVSPIVIPLVDKVKGMFNKLDPEVTEKEEDEKK